MVKENQLFFLKKTWSPFTCSKLYEFHSKKRTKFCRVSSAWGGITTNKYY